jgi:hypothetical protein
MADAFEKLGLPVTKSADAFESIGLPKEPPRPKDSFENLGLPAVGAVDTKAPKQPVVEEPEATAFERITQPWINIGAGAASAFNKGVGGFSQNIDDIVNYISEKTGMEKGGMFEEATKFYAKNTAYWDSKVKHAGLSEKIASEFVGGAIPGMAEFMLGVPMATLHGLSNDGVGGAVKSGVERALLGGILRSTEGLTRPLKTTALASVGATQAAAEGGSPEEIAKSAGVMAGFGAAGGRGTKGIREVARDAVGLDRVLRNANKLANESLVEVENPADRAKYYDDTAKERPPEQAKEQAKQSLEEDRRFSNEIHTKKDVAQHLVSLETNAMQREVQELAGPSSRKWKHNPLNYFSTEKQVKQSLASKDLDMAMLFYRDFVKTSPEKAQELRVYLNNEIKSAKGSKKIRAQENLRVLDKAETLTDAQKEFVDIRMDQAFNDNATFAQEQGILKTSVENYVRRIWDIENSNRGDARYGFKTFSTSQLQRTLPTVADGIMKGMNLKVRGITSSYEAIATEIQTIAANKGFMKMGLDTKMFTTKQKAGYAPLKADAFKTWVWKGKVSADAQRASEGSVLTIDNYGREVFFSPPEMRAKDGSVIEASEIFGRDRLYAPEGIADMINSMTRTAGSVWEAKGFKNALRLNAAIKGYALMSSFFHHYAGVRSWAFGVNHGVAASAKNLDVVGVIKGIKEMASPIEAHKKGLAKIQEKNEIITLGVKNGLTLGKMQDWNESLMSDRRGATETIVRGLGLSKTARTMEFAKLKRENFTNSLFRKFFAGLKAEAFSTEFAHRMKQASKKGKTPDVEVIAEQAATLINADFGGLHLRRMGRNPDIQKALQLLLLAPDWTESNFRTFTGMVPGANAFIGKMVNEMPEVPGMDGVYRGFWGGILIKSALSTVLTQLAINGVDDTKDFYKQEFASWDTARRLRWSSVDVTKAYDALGIDIDGNKKVASIVGHFADPLKLQDPARLAKGKASPLARIAMSAGTQSDYADRPFTGLKEWIETGGPFGGRTIKKSRYNDKEQFWNQAIPMTINQIISMQPIQMGYLIKYLQGEEDGLSALLSSSGMHISTSYKPPAQKRLSNRLQ